MEYVGGGDLSLRLRNGGLPLQELREYTQQLAEALAYLHGKHVVHKDLRVRAMANFVTVRWLAASQPSFAVVCFLDKMCMFFFILDPLSIVSRAAAFSVVTQRISLFGEEHCVTTLNKYSCFLSRQHKMCPGG